MGVECQPHIFRASFELKDAATDETLAWAHTTWMAIDMDSRRPTDLSRHQALVDIVTEREFGGDKGVNCCLWELRPRDIHIYLR